MYRVLLILALSAASALAQTKPASTAADESAVPSNAAVITIHRPCAGPVQRQHAPVSALCADIVSRRQFDTVMKALQATGRNLLPPARRQVAQGYVDLLIHSEAALQAGMDKDPRYKQLLQLARMRALADLYRIRLQEQARKISPAELSDYYHANLDKFEELQLRRVTLPRNNVDNLDDLAFRAEARRVADRIRARAANGEDMDKLQKEGFEVLGVKSPPPTLMAPVRRGAFDAGVEAKLFALKPGETTNVIEQPGVYIIYKLESRKTVPLAEAKPEISQTLYQQKLRDLTDAAGASVKVDYNDQYLGATQASAWVPAGSRHAGTGSSR